MTAAVFTGVLLAGNLLREVLPLLLSQHATFGMIAQMLGLLIPFLWVFALPMAMLTATLLVFGRFSADQELTAARASGVSLLSLTTPILILSLLLCAVSAAVNLEIAPRCRVAYNGLRFDLKAALVSLQLPEGRPIYDFPGHIVFIGKNRKNNLEQIYLLKLKTDTNLPEFTVYAPSGRLETDPDKQQMVLYLSNAVSVYSSTTPVMGNVIYSFKLDTSQKVMGKPGISDMTLEELLTELSVLENRLHLPLPSPDQGTADDAQVRKRLLQKQRSDMTEPIRVQIHRRVSFSFACFGFTLLGIPLGIRMHRRETNVGVAVALGLVAVYYGMVIIAESLSNRPELAPHLLMWLPNFVFQAVGAVLLWRANKGS